MTFDCQKNRPMQKANGLQLKLSGASYSSLMSGIVLGYSCHHYSITNHEKALAKKIQEVRKNVKLAMKVTELMKSAEKVDNNKPLIPLLHNFFKEITYINTLSSSKSSIPFIHQPSIQQKQNDVST